MCFCFEYVVLSLEYAALNVVLLYYQVWVVCGGYQTRTWFTRHILSAIDSNKSISLVTIVSIIVNTTSIVNTTVII